MQLEELGYNKSVRDKVFEAIWNVIGDNYRIVETPLNNVQGNVIVLSDEVYWECDKIVKLNKDGFNQRWTYYRPSIFAAKNNLVKTGCLIYNDSWYQKMVSGEVKERNNVSKLISVNKATVEEVSKYNWDGVDLNQRGIWGIKNLNGKVLGLYLDLDNDLKEIWKKEQEKQSLFCYEKMNDKGLKYEVFLSVADMVKKNNKITKEDMKNIYDGLCIVLQPQDIIKKRVKGKEVFNFGNDMQMDEVIREVRGVE